GGHAGLALVAREPHGVEATIEVPLRAREAGTTASADSRSGAAPNGAAAFTAAYPPPPSAQPPEQPSAARRTLAIMGSAERSWRKGLTFAFMVLVGAAGIVALLAVLGVITGTLPVMLGDDSLGTPLGAFVGTAGMRAACALV